MSEIESTNKLQSPGETQKVFDLLREIATDKSKIKQLNGVKKKLDKSVSELRSKIKENEKNNLCTLRTARTTHSRGQSKTIRVTF